MIISDIKFSIIEVEAGIYHIQFETQRDLCQSMMRLQEFYEGVDHTIKGQYFTFEEFIHHFTKENGEFEYTKIWCGFNVPGKIVESWYKLFSSQIEHLTNKENQVFSKLFQIIPSQRQWYLIATAKNNSKNIIKHEIAHGRFNIDDEYKRKCLQLLNEIDYKDRQIMNKSLFEMQYELLVIDDEIQAYLSTSSNKEIEFWFGKLSSKTKKVISKLKKLYKDRV